MLKKWISILLVGAFMVIGVTGCGKGAEVDADIKTIVYGKAAGPYTVLFEEAIIPILEKEGYQFK